MSISLKRPVAVIFVIVILLGLAFILLLHRASATKAQTQSDKIAAVIRQIDRANVGLPDPQVQAKSLMLAVRIQNAVPPAASWCDALNVGNKLWPVTPTNTFFALNSQLAGQTNLRSLSSDTVLFFETSQPGWNQAGGPELLANRPEGVAVALLDGRALVVSHDEAAKLRWAP